MKEITYTFIIPHHNCPDLLNRCLDSIPQRKDIQIIVVDDNSDEGKKPKESQRPEIEYIYIDKSDSKGAGRARNKGLEKAKGKWLIFSDSDDVFDKNVLNDKLDKYVDSNAEIIYFNTIRVDSNTLIPLKDEYEYNKIVNNKSEKSLEWLRYRSNVPWGKFIQGKLVERQNLRFSECIAGNDLFFSVTSGHHSERSEIDTDIIYLWCIRYQDNISSNRSKAAVLSKYNQTKLRNKFLMSVKKNEWVSNIFIQYFSHFKKIGYSWQKAIHTLWNDTPSEFRTRHIIEAIIIFVKNRFK